jgi:ribosomal protein S8E
VVDGEHEHDKSVTSLSVVQDGEVDLDLVNEWIRKLLNDHGKDIYRTKGILAIKHAEKFAFQAVHMIFSGEFTVPWGDAEPRVSKLVFIGKNLDIEKLRASFADCVSTEESVAKRAKLLRFKVGDKVKCRTGKNKFTKGVVVALMYREEFMSPGEVAPYQVELGNGERIYAPADTDDLIRAAA